MNKRTKRLPLSEAEEQCMTVVWTGGGEMNLLSVRNQTNARYKKNWAPQTVSTFLARIREKGYVTAHRKGRYTFYEPIVTKEEYRTERCRGMLETLYDGDKEKMISDILWGYHTEE